jgi:hypothetical protein
MSQACLRVGLCALLAWTAGCVGAPPAQTDLRDGESVRALSSHGLVAGELRAVGAVSAGSNDFALTLTPETAGTPATLESFVAIMPAHGHQATPARIEASTTGYDIVGLPLTMPGVWHLSGELRVDGTSDDISFDVDVP